MGIFSGLLKLGLHVVTTPIAVVKQVVDKDAISDHVDQMKDDVDEITEDF
jgi:hypothetical protein